MLIVSQIMSNRVDLKIVIMSATLDAGKFQAYFNNAPLLVSQLTHYSVTIIFSMASLND